MFELFIGLFSVFANLAIWFDWTPRGRAVRLGRNNAQFRDDAMRIWWAIGPEARKNYLATKHGARKVLMEKIVAETPVRDTLSGKFSDFQLFWGLYANHNILVNANTMWAKQAV